MAISDFKMSWLNGGGLVTVCNCAVRKSEVLKMELPSWQQSTFASVVFWICDCAIHLNIQHESTTSLCTMQILLIHLYIIIIFYYYYLYIYNVKESDVLRMRGGKLELCSFPTFFSASFRYYSPQNWTLQQQQQQQQQQIWVFFSASFRYYSPQNWTIQQQQI